MGPSQLFDLITHSDSEKAHEALVTLITSRLAPQDRPGLAFDGQDEFDHKSQIVLTLLGAYNEYKNDEDKSSLLKRDLEKILDAFTGDGSVAYSARENDQEYFKKSEARDIKEIASGMLTVLLASPDPELSGQAAGVIIFAMENKKALALETDPTLHSQSELMLVCLDALNYISENSNPSVLGQTAALVFESDEIGRTIQRFAEMKQQSAIIRNRPNVLKALLNWRKHNFTIDEKEKRENEKAKAIYEKEVYPSTDILRRLRKEKNQFLLGFVREAIIGNELTIPVLNAFGELVKRVEFSNYDMISIPDEYYQLMDIARLPGLTSDQKNKIVWHIAEQFKYLHDNSEGLLLPVVLDIYELILGPLDNVRMPDANTSHGLAAATHLVYENRSMFKAATPEQLKTLATYCKEIERLAKMVLRNEFLTEGNQEKSILEVDVNDLKEQIDPRKWNKETLYQIQSVARELNAIAQYYEEYLHIQAVKVDPSIYYPWMLQQLIPFWQKMNWEVGPGNRPSRDILSLFQMMEDYIKNRFVLEKELPKNFDCVEAGHLDGFLLELYNRVITNHDINYNGTVWREGHNYILAAVSNMPPVLLNQIINKHRGTPFAKWLKSEHERWNKEL